MMHETTHRPWPLPQHPWVMAMRWHDLLFMHWPIRPAALRPLIPAALTLEHWLTARYCLYAVDRHGRVGYGDIHHAPWPLQDATAEVRSNTMAMPLHVELPHTQPVLHFARYLEVVAWRVVPLVE